MKNEENYVDIITRTWNEQPNRLDSIKKVAFSLWSVFGTSYYWEQTSSIIKYIINPYRNHLNEVNSEMCIKLKLSNYEPYINMLASKVDPQGSWSLMFHSICFN